MLETNLPFREYLVLHPVVALPGSEKQVLALLARVALAFDIFYFPLGL